MGSLPDNVGGEMNHYFSMFDDFSREVISEVCDNADFVIRYIGQLCESDDDLEAIEETVCFLGLRWQDVTPELLRKRFTAFSFFTEMAFFSFMPSVIAASIEDPLSSHLAIENIIGTLPEPSSFYLREFYGRRWRMFNARQLNYLKTWIKCPEAQFRSYFDLSDLDEAVSAIDRYLCVASDLEDRAHVF